MMLFHATSTYVVHRMLTWRGPVSNNYLILAQSIAVFDHFAARGDLIGAGVKKSNVSNWSMTNAFARPA
jgi:hypothetical protein